MTFEPSSFEGPNWTVKPSFLGLFWGIPDGPVSRAGPDQVQSSVLAQSSRSGNPLQKLFPHLSRKVSTECLIHVFYFSNFYIFAWFWTWTTSRFSLMPFWSILGYFKIIRQLSACIWLHVSSESDPTFEMHFGFQFFLHNVISTKRNRHMMKLKKTWRASIIYSG